MKIQMEIFSIFQKTFEAVEECHLILRFYIKLRNWQNKWQTNLNGYTVTNFVDNHFSHFNGLIFYKSEYIKSIMSNSFVLT